MIQSEAQLESGLVKRLHSLGWDPVTITDGAGLRANLKAQLEAQNDVSLSDAEFTRVLNHLDKGNVFDKAKIVRDRMALPRDDGTTTYVQFLNTEEWCRNRYQVTSQVTQAGSYKNRYDVTLLINGLPLIQVELKRRGMELKEAFNQVNRYQRHSYWSDHGLFQYVQLFVISNGVNTKYYANNRDQDFNQTFFWADVENKLITQLDAFADAFLEKCHASKMISKYIVLHESNKVLMVLRPYQYFAVEAIVERVKAGRKNGYIWHTTGSGKTLTSFKAAQVLIENPKVHKVVFVVDRSDLDYQTTKEFNHFSDGSVDGTDNTRALVKQLAGDHKLIVTTIQKLNTAISRDKFEGPLQAVKDERVVFIFDECHRSQFGETHKRIVAYFSFTQFSPDDLTLDPQKFEDYKSKYLDIYDRTKRTMETEAVSIIDEVDFELELIQRDEINVAYILGLLAEVSRDANSLDATQRDESARKRKLVMDMLGSEAQLRSKRELIERFIEQHMPKAQDSGASVEETFLAFWNDERVKAMEAVCTEEGIPPAAFQRLVEDYQFTGKPPLREAVIDVLEKKPKILERKKITERIIDKLLGLVATFDDGLGGI